MNALARPKAPKILIAGFGMGRLFQNPAFDDPEYEVWGCNVYQWTHDDLAYDRWFDIHPIDVQESRHPESCLRLRHLEDSPILYLQEQVERYPTSVTYPIAELMALWPHGHYHAGTFDYMVALACLLRVGAARSITADGGDPTVEEIHLRGITLAWGEPIAAKACLEYWCGIAEGLGIKVVAEPWSDLFNYPYVAMTDKPYGYRYLQHAHGYSPTREGWADLMAAYAEYDGEEPSDEVQEILATRLPLSEKFTPTEPELQLPEPGEAEKKQSSGS